MSAFGGGLGPQQWNMGQAQGDVLAMQRRAELARSLANQGMQVAGQGPLGILASVLGQVQAQRAEKRADESVTEFMERSFRAEQEAARQQAEAAQRASQLEFDRQKELASHKAGLKGPARHAVGGSLIDDMGNVLYQAPEKPQAPRAPSALQERLEAAKAMGATPDQLRAIVLGDSAQGGQKAPSGYRYAESGELEPIPGGPADESSKPPAIGQEAKRQIALLDNAIANAEEYKSRVVGEGGQFNDIDSRLRDTPELLNSAIQDYLYVKTGAAAPAEEVAKAEGFYKPSNVTLPLIGSTGIPNERDSTASAKVERLLADLYRHREMLVGSGQRPAASDDDALIAKYLD